uniref:TetR/AcrR family transcriptional regulator n=1 Tax=Blastomonas sp. UPD001 TaxID=2217673 RepID=UPI001300912C
LREGAAAASVKTIAAEAGVNHGLIHHHFGSKEALMIAVHEQMPFELPILKRQDVEEDARMLMHAMFRQQRVSLELLTLSYQMPALNARMRSRVQQVFEGYRTVLGEHSIAQLTEFGATILGLAVYSDVHADLPVADALKNLLRRYIDYPD